MSGTSSTPLRIARSHPSLAGHFPGDPVVPGVVVLERVAAAWKASRGAQVDSLDAKFSVPLRPDENATIELQGDGVRARFVVLRADGQTVARGTLVAAP